MPVYVIVILNLVLCAAVVAAIVGLASWSIATQHRDPHCASVRIPKRRLRFRVNLARVEPAPTPEAPDLTGIRVVR